MTYTPYATVAQLDTERIREQRATALEAATLKASVSRATTPATSFSKPSTLSSVKSSVGPAASLKTRLHRPSTSTSSPSMSHPRPTRNHTSSSSASRRLVDMRDLHLEDDHPELDSSSEYSASETEAEYETCLESRRPTYETYLARPSLARDFAAVTENYVRASPSPPKQTVENLPLLVEPENGPGLGFGGDRGQWYEVEEDHGHASWTAFAGSNDRGRTHRNSTIIVQECRW